MPFRFRPPDADDAARLLAWRTRPDVTRHMLTDIENPDIDAQKEWLRRMAGRNDFRHFIIEVATENRPIGYLSFTDIDWRNRHCSSGQYIGDPADRRRYAGLLYPFALDYCFIALDMLKFVNIYLDNNQRLIRAHQLLGYREVGVLRRHVLKQGHWHDVQIMELFREDYQTKPRIFPSEHTLAAFGLAP